jgi:hypothetical protein
MFGFSSDFESSILCLFSICLINFPIQHLPFIYKILYIPILEAKINDIPPIVVNLKKTKAGALIFRLIFRGFLDNLTTLDLGFAFFTK